MFLYFNLIRALLLIETEISWLLLLLWKNIILNSVVLGTSFILQNLCPKVTMAMWTCGNGTWLSIKRTLVQRKKTDFNYLNNIESLKRRVKSLKSTYNLFFTVNLAYQIIIFELIYFNHEQVNFLQVNLTMQYIGLFQFQIQNKKPNRNIILKHTKPFHFSYFT